MTMNKKKDNIKRFTLIQAAGCAVSVTIAIMLASVLTDTAFWFAEVSICLGALFTVVFSALHIYGYDTASLDLRTGNFKGSADFEHRKESFLMLTEVTPLSYEEEEKKEE